MMIDTTIEAMIKDTMIEEVDGSSTTTSAARQVSSAAHR